MAAGVSESASSAFLALVEPPEAQVALPDVVPEAIDRDDFGTSNFSADSFLAERRMFALEKLKNDLKNHLANMKSELIELINQDYSDFINLSTNLVGVDKMISDLNKPLDKIKTDVLAVRSSMQTTVEGLQSKLEKRAQLREKKSLLQLFLSIHESVGKVEALLGIESAGVSLDRSVVDAGADGQPAGAVPGGDGDLDLKMMERVAIEFNQLQFLVNRGKGLPFVQNLDPRIFRVQDTLQLGMKKALAGALDAYFRDRSSASAVSSLTQCLRTYALIDRTVLAEEGIRTALYDPFLSKVVTPASLDFDPLLPMGTKPLQHLYSRILDFTKAEFLPLLKLTERALKGTPFQMLTNVVWIAVTSAIQKYLTSIFSPGIPDAFHENFILTMDFVAKLEALAPDAKALRYLRAHTSYLEFMRRWQAPVYFQIRFTAISGTFEDSVAGATTKTVTSCLDSLDSMDLTDGRLLLHVSKALLDAISICWAGNVWLYSLSFRFWKLTLQCIGRYALWLRGMTDVYRDKDRSRAASPSPVDGATTGNATPPMVGKDDSLDDEDQAMLNVLSVLSYEVRALRTKLKEQYVAVILPKLPASALESGVIQGSFDAALLELSDAVPSFADRATSVLSKRCASQLQQIRNIPALYRRTNRDAPTTASYFVSQILKPLTAFADATKPLLDDVEMAAWIESTVNVVTEKYSAAADELLTTVRKTEDSLKRLKKQLKRPGAAANAGEEGISDEDKIRMQVALDVRQYGKEMEALGVPTEGNVAYGQLVVVTSEQASEQ